MPRKDRRFTAKDMHRLICKHLSPKDMLVYEAMFFAGCEGVLASKPIICELSASLSRILNLMGFIKKIGLALGGGVTLKIVIEYLKKSKIMKIKRLNWILIGVILLLAMVYKVITSVGDLVGDIATLEDFLEKLNEYCGTDFISGEAEKAVEDVDIDELKKWINENLGALKKSGLF